MLTFIIIVAHILIIYFDGYPLVKNGRKKEMVLYCSLITLSLIVSVLLSLGVEVPNPADFIEKIVLAIVK